MSYPWYSTAFRVQRDCKGSLDSNSRVITCARTANNAVLKILTFVGCDTNIRCLTQSALYNLQQPRCTESMQTFRNPCLKALSRHRNEATQQQDYVSRTERIALQWMGFLLHFCSAIVFCTHPLPQYELMCACVCVCVHVFKTCSVPLPSQQQERGAEYP